MILKGCLRNFLVIIVGIIVLFAYVNSSWALPTGRIDIFDPLIYPEEQFRIDIVAEGVESSDAVLAFGVDLDFDSTWTLDNVVPCLKSSFPNFSNS